MNDATKKKLYIAGFIFNILLLIFWSTIVLLGYISVAIVNDIFNDPNDIPLRIHLGFWLPPLIIIMNTRPLWKLSKGKTINLFEKIIIGLNIIPILIAILIGYIFLISFSKYFIYQN